MSEENHHRHHHTITLVIALIALLVACVLPFLMRERMRGELRETTRVLSSEQETLVARIDTLKTAVDGLAIKAEPDATSIAELKRNVAETSTMIEVLGARLDEIEKKAAEKKPEPAPVAAVIVPSPVAATPAPPPATPVSEFSALKLAMLSGNAYANELAMWEKAQAPTTKAPVALGAFAQVGIPNEAALIRDLRAALTAAETPAAADDVSVAGKINTHLSGLVSIKKTTANAPYAGLYRDIDRAELQTLVRDVEQLDEPARAPLAAWLKTAKTRAEALSALHTFEPKIGQ